MSKIFNINELLHNGNPFHSTVFLPTTKSKDGRLSRFFLPVNPAEHGLESGLSVGVLTECVHDGPSALLGHSAAAAGVYDGHAVKGLSERLGGRL